MKVITYLLFIFVLYSKGQSVVVHQHRWRDYFGAVVLGGGVVWATAHLIKVRTYNPLRILLFTSNINIVTGIILSFKGLFFGEKCSPGYEYI